MGARMPLPMATVREDSGQRLGRVLEAVFHGSEPIRATAALLVEPPPISADLALDSQVARTQHFSGAVNAALERLGPKGLFALQVAKEEHITVPPRLPTGELLVDLVARWILRNLAAWPNRAMALAVATGRLIEESRRLNPARRREKPLGVGFDDRLEMRLRLRFRYLGDELGLFAALDEHEVLLLEAPAAGRRAIADDIGRDLKRGEREWLEAERFARMLARSRATDKKYQEGQIRWYLRQDPDDAVVLDRYGAVGHWLVVGDGDPGALARAGVLAARATDEQRKQSADAWRALVVGGSSPAAKGDGVVPIEEAHRLPPVERGRGGPSLDRRMLNIGAMIDRIAPANSDRAERMIAEAATAAAPATLFAAPAETTRARARPAAATNSWSATVGSS